MPGNIPSTIPKDSLLYIRAGTIVLATLMLFLDIIHISQLKRTFALQRYPLLPWPFSTFLSDPTFPDSPISGPSESDLHGYYRLLLLPDLYVIGMVIFLVVEKGGWLRGAERVVGVRRCRDGVYHAGLRCLFMVIGVVWVLWWPVIEIGKVRRYKELMYGGTKDGIGRRSLGDPFGGGRGAGGVLVNGGGMEMKKREVLRRLEHEEHQGQEQEIGERVSLVDRGVVFPSLVSLSPAPVPTVLETENAAVENTRVTRLSAISTETMTTTTSNNTVTAILRKQSAPVVPLTRTRTLPLLPTPYTTTIPTTATAAANAKREYEWTPPGSGSIYFCFINHLDVAPYAPLISCGVYRTRNIFAFVVMALLVVEVVVAFLVGDLSLSGGEFMMRGSR